MYIKIVKPVLRIGAHNGACYSVLVSNVTLLGVTWADRWWRISWPRYWRRAGFYRSGRG